MRDLFQGDDGGWLQDVALLDRLVAEKLEREPRPFAPRAGNGSRSRPTFPYGHTYGLRQICGERQPLTEEEAATLDALAGRGRRSSRKLCRGGRNARGSRSAPRRDRDGDRRHRAAAGQFMIPPKSPGPAPSSASTDRADCASSAAMSAPRTKRRSKSRRRTSRRTRSKRMPLDAERRSAAKTAAPNRRRGSIRARGGRGRRPAALARQTADRTHRLSHAGAARGDRQ